MDMNAHLIGAAALTMEKINKSFFETNSIRDYPIIAASPGSAGDTAHSRTRYPAANAQIN